MHIWGLGINACTRDKTPKQPPPLPPPINPLWNNGDRLRPFIRLYKSRIFKRLRSPGIDSKVNSASLCSLAGRYDNPIPVRFLAPIDCLKIPAQFSEQVQVGKTCYCACTVCCDMHNSLYSGQDKLTWWHWWHFHCCSSSCHCFPYRPGGRLDRPGGRRDRPGVRLGSPDRLFLLHPSSFQPRKVFESIRTIRFTQ